MQNVYIGTELKLNINIEPIEGQTMDKYNFEVEAFCSPHKSITIKKGDNYCIRVDESNYIILVDTSKVGIGNLKCKVTAFIPDTHFDDFFRTEVVLLDTDIQIVKI